MWQRTQSTPICVVCLGQKLFLSLTSAFSVPLLILQRPRKQQRFSLLCHVWSCLLKLENCFSSLFLRIESCTVHTVNLFQLVFGSTMRLSWIWSGKQSVFLLMVWRMWQRSSFSVHLCGDDGSQMMFVENWSLSARSVFIDSKLLFHLMSPFRPRIFVFFFFCALFNVSAAAQSKLFTWNYSSQWKIFNNRHNWSNIFLNQGRKNKEQSQYQIYIIMQKDAHQQILTTSASLLRSAGCYWWVWWGQLARQCGSISTQGRL